MPFTELWQAAIVAGLILSIAFCFGLLAKRSGRNPLLWGMLSVLSPVNLIILGYWACTRRLPFDRA